MINKYAMIMGGADKHALALTRLLRKRGHAVELVATKDPGNRDQWGAFTPLAVTHSSRGELTARRGAEVALHALWNNRAAGAMKAVIASFRPDVVHVHKLYPQLSVAPVVVAGAHGIPVVQTLHDYELIAASPFDDRGGWLAGDDEALRFRILRSVLHPVHRLVHAPRVRRWIAVSRYVARVHTAHGIRAEVLPNFIEAPRVGKPPDFQERSGVLFVGRLAEEKGVRDVIRLAHRLESVPLTIVGSGPLDQVARAESRRLRNLEHLGQLSEDDVARRMRTARLVVVPSRWQEPGALVALEAMAQGTPVVAYAKGGLAEYVSDARAGELVPESDERLAGACRELYRDRRRWEELSANGRSAVESTHSPDRYVQQLEGLYAGVAATA